jgi:hypothetical protein
LPCAGLSGEGKARPSFLKKRSKKLLLLEADAGDRSATAIKSFLVLFFKKELLSYPFAEVPTPGDDFSTRPR